MQRKAAVRSPELRAAAKPNKIIAGRNTTSDEQPGQSANGLIKEGHRRTRISAQDFAAGQREEPEGAC